MKLAESIIEMNEASIKLGKKELLANSEDGKIHNVVVERRDIYQNNYSSSKEKSIKKTLVFHKGEDGKSSVVVYLSGMPFRCSDKEELLKAVKNKNYQFKEIKFTNDKSKYVLIEVL